MATGMGPPRLTSLSHGAGCACKLGPAELAALIGNLPQPDDPDLLVGPQTADDAAVYRLNDNLALVQTVDFFTPIVDDPYDYGRIAATNALSDIYAMGGEPLLALNIVAFSLRDLGAAMLEEILRGGAEVAERAGIALAGGHSIDDPEPKYGLAVTGTVDPEHLLTNAGAEPGDALFLTKPIGGGLVTTAAKRGLASEELIERATAVMTELNGNAARAAVTGGAHAVTDVTGFGLLGHLHELCAASGVAAEVDAASVPAIEGVLELARNDDCIAGGSRRNADYAARFTTWDETVDAAHRVLLSDAMTSGGLLIATPEDAADAAPGVRFGGLVEDSAGEIHGL